MNDATTIATKRAPGADTVRIKALFHERNEEDERFRERLKELFAISTELSKAESLDDLCHAAVELGCGRLGFDRLPICPGIVSPPNA